MLKESEGVAHAEANERDIDVETTRQVNARTNCLIIDYEADDSVVGKRARAYFVKALIRADDGSITQLDDERIIVTQWK